MKFKKEKKFKLSYKEKKLTHWDISISKREQINTSLKNSYSCGSVIWLIVKRRSISAAFVLENKTHLISVSSLW